MLLKQLDDGVNECAGDGDDDDDVSEWKWEAPRLAGEALYLWVLCWVGFFLSSFGFCLGFLFGEVVDAWPWHCRRRRWVRHVKHGGRGGCG